MMMEMLMHLVLLPYRMRMQMRMPETGPVHTLHTFRHEKSTARRHTKLLPRSELL